MNMVSPPRTLLEIAGFKPQPSAWRESALLLIDCQKEYLEGGLPLPGIRAAVAEAKRLLDAARAAKAPVFHIVHHGRAGGPLFNPEANLVSIAPELAPLEGEMTIVKGLPNAFAKTALDAALQAADRKALIVAGFMTHMCVSATARAATDLGYRVTIVAEATGTRDLPDPLGGGIIPAATVHRTALAELADRFATVVAKTEAIPA